MKMALSVVLGAGELLNTLLIIGSTLNPSEWAQIRRSIEAADSVISPGPFPWLGLAYMAAPVAGAAAHFIAWLFRPWDFGAPYWPFKLWRMGWLSVLPDWSPPAVTRSVIAFALVVSGLLALVSIAASVSEGSVFGTVLFAANAVAAALALVWRPWRSSGSSALTSGA